MIIITIHNLDTKEFHSYPAKEVTMVIVPGYKQTLEAGILTTTKETRLLKLEATLNDR